MCLRRSLSVFAAFYCFIIFQLSSASPFKATERINEECPEWCNGSQCHWEICRSCEFTCGKRKCYHNIVSDCNFKCTPLDCNTRESCKGCIFCDSIGRMCPLGTFDDVTSTIFPKNETYWYKITHSGLPYNHYGAPLLVDLNGDGVLDYFNSMHAHGGNVSGLFKRMELAERVSNNFTTNGLGNLHPVSERIEFTNDIDFETSLDPHDQNVVDLDGDGVQDILIASGLGSGMNEDYITSRENFLLWGERKVDEMTGEIYTIFRGGREAAYDAGVAMRYSRGRVNYLLDANGDGLLDIFCIQDRSVSNHVSPGILLINQGNRTWKKDESMQEYTRSMLLTDADGDGFAQEVLLSRGFCYPQRNGPEVDQNLPSYGPFSANVKHFCSTRPVGSTAVFKFNHTSSSMDQISKHYENVSPEKYKQPPCCPHGTNSGAGTNCHAVSMATADFDNDGLTDHVVLYGSKMLLYLSSDRSKGELPIGDKMGVKIKFPSNCGRAKSLRVVDINNDGIEEIMIMCRNSARFLIYEKGNSKEDWNLAEGCNDNGSLGALSDFGLTRATKADLEIMCSDKEKINNWTRLVEICSRFTSKRIIRQVENSGWCIADLDNDGFLDIVVSYDFGYLRFFRNNPSEPSKANRFIAFQLKGSGPVNQYGIGAIIILKTRINDTLALTSQFREFGSYQHASDKYGCKEDRVIFGLGQKAKPVRVEVRWPNGIIQIWDLEYWAFSSRVKPIELVYSAPSATPSTMEPTASAFPSTGQPTSEPSTWPTTSAPSASPPTSQQTSKPSNWPTTSTPTLSASPSTSQPTSKPSNWPTTSTPTLSA